VFRGHKADIYEGGHRVPFIVKWTQKVQPGSSSDQTICTTDFFATVAEITGAQPQENEGEDSFSMLPLLMDSPSSNYGRTSIVHHSINGSFALRKGKWKLIFAPGSGGWSSPKPNSEEEKNLPAYQLYDLTTDIAEQQNLQDEYPEIVEELKAEMASLISNGRSTPGNTQSNEMPLNGKSWEQIAQFTDENNSASN
jgi:arylsulfatase A-like enzyme